MTLSKWRVWWVRKLLSLFELKKNCRKLGAISTTHPSTQMASPHPSWVDSARAHSATFDAPFELQGPPSVDQPALLQHQAVQVVRPLGLAQVGRRGWPPAHVPRRGGAVQARRTRLVVGRVPPREAEAKRDVSLRLQLSHRRYTEVRPLPYEALLLTRAELPGLAFSRPKNKFGL